MVLSDHSSFEIKGRSMARRRPRQRAATLRKGIDCAWIGAFALSRQPVSVVAAFVERPLCPEATIFSRSLGAAMSDKSPQKDSAKKVGKSLKEKRASKKAKKETKANFLDKS
jgi:hypothetical protein